MEESIDEMACEDGIVLRSLYVLTCYGAYQSITAHLKHEYAILKKKTKCGQMNSKYNMCG